MNYDEIRGRQGASMLNHVATLVGQDQFCFSHYFLTMAIAFLGIAVMLRVQAGVECSIYIFFLLKINWNGLNVFTLVSMVKIASEFEFSQFEQPKRTN